jgi:flagellar protein FliS
MNASMIRNRYVGTSVETASPARLVTMLYDRLVRDLTTAETALARSDIEGANNALIHAHEMERRPGPGCALPVHPGGAP